MCDPRVIVQNVETSQLVIESVSSYVQTAYTHIQGVYKEPLSHPHLRLHIEYYRRVGIRLLECH